MNIENLFLSALAISVITTTLSKGAIFSGLRSKLPSKFLINLFNCPYCLAHWVSIPFAFNFSNFVISIFALVALSSLPSFFLIIYLRWLDNVKI